MSLDNINNINNGFGDFYSKQRQIEVEVGKIKDKLSKKFKDGEDIKTYF